MRTTHEATLLMAAEHERLKARIRLSEDDHRRRVFDGFVVRRFRVHESRDTRTCVVETPIALAMRAKVSSEGVCRPASTRAMFGR